MYSTTPCVNFSPWRQHTWTKRVHEENHQNGTSQAPSLHSLAQESRVPPPEASQFSPPLAAYSTEKCGPNLEYVRYNRSIQLAALSGLRDGVLLSPQNLTRLEALRRIRATGYTTLAPVGVCRTMAQIHYDAQLEDEDSQVVQAENLGTVGASTTVGADSPAVFADNAVLGDMDRDLDASVPDADTSDDGVGEDSLTPDAFMAEDVEYQDDHSLEGEPVFSVGVEARTASTVTSAPLRNCDDSDMDMVLEAD